MATLVELMGLGMPSSQAQALIESKNAASAGNVTMNVPLGIIKIAAAASSATLTSDKIRNSSYVFATVQTNDATLKSVACVVSAGSCQFVGNAAATAATNVAFWIIG